MSASMGRTSIIASSASEGKDLLPSISGKVRWWAFPDFSLHPAEWRGTSCLRIVSAAGSDKRGICDNTTGRTSVRTCQQRLSIASQQTAWHGSDRDSYGTGATAVLANCHKPSCAALTFSLLIATRTYAPQVPRRQVPAGRLPCMPNAARRAARLIAWTPAA